MNRKRIILIAVLALLLIATIVLAATIDLWSDNVDVWSVSFLFSGQNGRLTKAIIGLVVFVILGLLGVIYKGPKR